MVMRYLHKSTAEKARALIWQHMLLKPQKKLFSWATVRSVHVSRDGYQEIESPVSTVRRIRHVTYSNCYHSLLLTHRYMKPR